MISLDIQRIRNLTTGKLHTSVGDIYLDIEFFVGEAGIMTHMIPSAYRALKPFLKSRFLDTRFWDDQYDPTHTGFVLVYPLDKFEKATFWKTFAEFRSKDSF